MTRRALLTGVLLAAAGCSKSPPPIVEVRGRVTVNGQPLPRAEVRFYPAIDFVGGEYIAVGETDDDGRYVLTCLGKSGACACENRVTVTDAPLPDDLRGYSAAAQTRQAVYQKSLKNRPIPPRYGTLAQSPLVVTVAADRQEYDLELTR